MLLCLALLSAAQLYAFALPSGLTVSTQQGPVVGTFSTPSVRQFLGVSYATAERWQAPVLPPKRRQTFNASAFGDSCPQLLTPFNIEFTRVAWTFGTDDGIFVPESEDCLNINIWSPSLDRKQSTAVMVWIYGGANDWGTSRLPAYDGTNLVRDNDDVTVVSFNYRLNIFGQPNAPQFDIPGRPQNFGLLDISAAIKWTHDNIANFGGDPNRIVLFGQSPPAIDDYGLANPNDKIVKGFIQQSGDTSTYQASLPFLANDPTGTPPRINSTTWNAVAEAVGCGAIPTAPQLSCMRRVPSKRLQDTATTNNVDFNLVQDGVTHFNDSAQRVAAGKYLKVPLLAGSTENEMDSFTAAGELVAFGDVVPTVSEIISDIETNIQFVCPMTKRLASHVNAGMKVFRYEYQAVFPNLSRQPGIRAFHGSDVHTIFGTYNNSPISAPSETEITFSKYMQSIWVGFARDPQAGLVELGWPLYDPQKPTLVQLGGPVNLTGSVLTDPSRIAVLCRNETFLFETLGGLSALLSSP